MTISNPNVFIPMVTKRCLRFREFHELAISHSRVWKKVFPIVCRVMIGGSMNCW